MPPLLTPLAKPVEPETQWVLPERFDEAAARERTLKRATRGPLRPADATMFTKVSAATRYYAPFWRVEIETEGWTLDSNTSGNETRIQFDSVEGRRALSVLARRTFRVTGDSDRHGLIGGGLAIPPNGVVERASDGQRWLDTATVVEADVDWPEAEAWALSTAKRLIGGSDTILAKTKVRTLAMQFVWLPVWWVDYEYSGEADPNNEGGFAVAWVPESWYVLSERHPSKARAVAGRVRRLMSFDKQAFDGLAFWRK